MRNLQIFFAYSVRMAINRGVIGVMDINEKSAPGRLWSQRDADHERSWSCLDYASTGVRYFARMYPPARSQT